MSTRRLETELLVQAGRLLLEYNESTGAIHRALTSTAKALTGETCQVAVSYGGVVVTLPGEAPAIEGVKELRYNNAVQAQVHTILGQVRRGDLEPAAALDCLQRVEAESERQHHDHGHGDGHARQRAADDAGDGADQQRDQVLQLQHRPHVREEQFVVVHMLLHVPRGSSSDR